jgi:TatD DNase family protein
MIDVHCHLTKIEEKDEIIKDAKCKLDAIVTSGLQLEDAREAIQLHEDHRDFVYVSAGIHPTIAVTLTDMELDEYFEFLVKNRAEINAIGEVGLDYHYIKDESKIKRMKEVFIEFLAIAKELDLPVILHLRDAFSDGLEILLDKDVKRAVFHCYSGKKGLAEEIVEEGYLISLATNIVRNKNARNVAKGIPLEYLLTETDAPYLRIKEEKSTPMDVELVVKKIAELKKIEVDEVKKATVQNAKDSFEFMKG